MYRRIVEQVQRTMDQGSPPQKIGAETWGPAVEKHRPSGEAVGDTCVQCGEQWPCRFLRGLLRSGMLMPHEGLPS
ncbi:hypothetical protein LK10_02135 [Sinomonas humi]|uniref:Uncharacterized protein n=1 Tax=Sinomonas humi TaxID=1338436 RepID=A0A0B2ATA7_9MICC|nr:hypothetical protein LK10_02135 [Sinomonas humi]